MKTETSEIGLIGTTIKRRREALGLTQARLAVFASLSRTAVNDLENGAASDLGVNKVLRLLNVLGIAITLEPKKAKDGQSPGKALTVAAKSASMSYKTELPTDELRLALRTDKVPDQFRAHIATLLDEAPIAILVRAIEEAFESNVPKSAWRRVARWATDFKSTRDVWN